MSAHTQGSATDSTDEEKSRAIEAGLAWVDEFLDDHVVLQVEALQRALAQHALTGLRLALGPRYGQRATALVIEVLSPVPPGPESEAVRERLHAGDTTLLEDGAVDIDWLDISAELGHLFAYARYGHGRCADPGASRADIEALIGHFHRVVTDSALRAAAITGFDWLEETLAAAEARWATDHGRSVAPDDLAALANVKPKTIANLVSAREIASDGEGRIPAAEALRYLERRDGFVRSTWHHPAEPPQPEANAAASSLAEQVFVPVDSDGNPFLPNIARPGRDRVARYAIGAKSDPEFVEDYWEALDRLARMPTPRWRRPPMSGKGGWSLVSAQDGWRRFARSDLEKMLANVRDGRQPT